MIDQVILLPLIGDGVDQPQIAHEREQLVVGGGGRLELGIEEGGVGLETGNVIALGVCRNKHHLTVGRHLLQLVINRSHICQGSGADIGAEGVADKQKGPVPLQVGRGERLVVRIGKGEIIDIPPCRIVVSLLRLLRLGGVERQGQAACQQ